MTVNWLQILLAAAAGGVITFLFNRVSRSLDLGVVKEEQTSTKIEKVDTEARNSITRVERELKGLLETLKTSMSASIMDLALRLTRVEETVLHLPSAEQIDRLIDRLGGVERDVGVLGAKVDGQSEMVRTIRDHIMQKELS